MNEKIGKDVMHEISSMINVNVLLLFFPGLAVFVRYA